MNFEEWFEKDYGVMFKEGKNEELVLSFKEVARHSWNAALHYRRTPYGLKEIKKGDKDGNR
jgi:hypothetical protein